MVVPKQELGNEKKKTAEGGGATFFPWGGRIIPPINSKLATRNLKLFKPRRGFR
jgi:hypothetical protein